MLFVRCYVGLTGFIGCFSSTAWQDLDFVFPYSFVIGQKEVDCEGLVISFIFTFILFFQGLFWRKKQRGSLDKDV